MGKRRDRFNLRIVEQAESRAHNGPLKVKERVRRETRMMSALKAGKFPYTRAVRSWLCIQLDKKEFQITEADVQKFMKA
jgi:hypothetical protein